jgi:predicted dehydrogenase
MVKIIIIGAGSRGLRSYGKWLHNNPEAAQVVAVADPRESRRQEAMDLFGIKPDKVFKNWQEAFDQPKMADAAIIATCDDDHVDPAVKAAELGYNILLEKPMAPAVSDCIRIADAARKNNIIFALCHVLHYAPFYKQLKKMIDDGQVGKLISIQHLEGIAWWHFAHAYVRGNWRNEKLSSSILLAKCCHDLDLINWIAGSQCQTVQSSGKLNFFKAENAPENSTDRCIDCMYSKNKCPYSAEKFYHEKLEQGFMGWPLDVLVDDMTHEAIDKALREGPYGRCVYKCDNDVADSQSVNLEFKNGVTFSMMLSAFTPHGRKIRVMGSHGYIEGDGKILRHLSFQEDKWTEIDVNKLNDDVESGHGGGDAELMKSFIEAVEKNDPSYLSADLTQTLESHLLVFAAEEARKNKTIIDFPEYCKNVLP